MFLSVATADLGTTMCEEQSRVKNHLMVSKYPITNDVKFYYLKEEWRDIFVLVVEGHQIM